MNNRKRLIPALVQLLENHAGIWKIHNLLFLVSQIQTKPAFHFIPLSNGCYSFQLAQDIRSLEKQHTLNATGEKVEKTDPHDHFMALPDKDKQVLRHIVNKYGGMSPDELTSTIFNEYPQFAVYNPEAQQIPEVKSSKHLKPEQPASSGKILFTIGYEGLSLEEYLMKLLANEVEVLCDVRKNPGSRKFGFSKKTLENACECVGIKYQLFTDLGIDKAKRQNIKTRADKQALLADYQQTILREAIEAQMQLLTCFDHYKKVALTCYEYEHTECHRSYLAESLKAMAGQKITISHI